MRLNRNTTVKLILLAIICLGNEGFKLPSHIPAEDFIAQNTITPPNSDPLFFSELLRKSLATLFNYQQSVEACISHLKQTQGCDEGQHGIPNKVVPANELETTSVNVKDGVITLFPIVNKDVTPNSNLSIVTTPQYNGGQVTWDYSGNLFDYDKLKYLKKQMTESVTCPDPATFPASFKNYHYFVDLAHIKYVLSGYKAHTENDESISFLWAAYPSEKNQERVACIYRIGEDPSLTNNWFSLTTVDEVAEIPQDGLWNSVQRGVCPSTNTLAALPKVSDCSFKLKKSKTKS